MTQFNEIDIVELTEDVNGWGDTPDDVVHLHCGEQGTIVVAFTKPHEAYDVEFIRDGGYRSEFATVLPNQIKLIKSYS